MNKIKNIGTRIQYYYKINRADLLTQKMFNDKCIKYNCFDSYVEAKKYNKKKGLKKQ